MAKMNSLTKVFQAPSQMTWPDEKLASLSNVQLEVLLENLRGMRDDGRISASVADDVAQRIAHRLPPEKRTGKRRRAPGEAKLDARIGRQLGELAAKLGLRYDLSAATAAHQSADVDGFRPLEMTASNGDARTNASVREGRMAIERYITYRARNSLANLAYVLFPNQPGETGRYVLLATDDLLERSETDEAVAEEYETIAQRYGWSESSRARMRARVASGFAEAERLYEELIDRVAQKRS